MKTEKPDSPNDNPFKFNKEAYWERRKKGLTGTVHPIGSKESRYDLRHAMKRIHQDEMARLRKGKK